MPMRTTERERAQLLASDVYNFVFEQIANEIEFTGDDAGKLAAAVEAAYLAAYAALVLPNEPNPFA